MLHQVLVKVNLVLMELSVAIIVMLSFPFLASPAVTASDLYPVRVGTLYGFIDRGGKLVLKAQYESAGVFREGLASVWSKRDR